MPKHKNDTVKLVKDFVKFAGLLDCTDAEIPNISMNGGLTIPEKLCSIIKEYDFGDTYDPLDDVLTLISPEYLAYILIAAKEFWKEKMSENRFSSAISLCKNCCCMTHTLKDGKCGKCGAVKGDYELVDEE